MTGDRLACNLNAVCFGITFAMLTMAHASQQTNAAHRGGQVRVHHTVCQWFFELTHNSILSHLNPMSCLWEEQMLHSDHVIIKQWILNWNWSKPIVHYSDWIGPLLVNWEHLFFLLYVLILYKHLECTKCFNSNIRNGTYWTYVNDFMILCADSWLQQNKLGHI